MLPGFRFLFGATILLLSILVFGFGAAALLRTAHEEFASAPAWRPAPETRFAQAHEATPPVLALFPFDINIWYGTPAQGITVDDWSDDTYDHTGLGFV